MSNNQALLWLQQAPVINKSCINQPILMLLIKSTEHVKLQRTAPKILKFCTAVEGYVYISTSEGDVEKLIHIDKQGKILWEKDYQDSIDTFAMFNEREVIVLNVKESTIEIVDLVTHTIRSYPHQYNSDDTASMEIYDFNDSKLFCVVERGGSSNDGRLYAAYFSYDSQDMKEIAHFVSPAEWNPELTISKVNNHSKLAWWKPKHDDFIEFQTLDLQEQPAGVLTKINIANTLRLDYNMNNFSLEIANLWEKEPHVYLLVCNSNKESKNEEKNTNNNYILDVRKEIIRETKFNFGEWSNRLMDYFNLGEVSAFHTFSYINGEAQSSPVFYVNNQREEIISVEEWKATSKTNFYIPGFDTSTIIETVHENGDVDEVEVTTKKLMTPQEMYLHFMLHMNEDFDDDLLHDALRLLTEID